ncbi:hypothetical protein AAC387_Pa12g1988 [Persea americana]
MDISPMAYTFPLIFSNLPVSTAILIIIFPVAESYKSIFSFGDSLADTGNYLHLRANDHPRVGQSPYGQTYFHHPTGRFSDGRLVIDFIAQAIGIPFLPPYFACPSDYDFRRGVNFAVGGATALDPEFFEERGIYVETNYSLGHQIDRFKRILPSICSSPSDCRKILSEYLFLVGEIGGNDYNHPFIMGWTIQEMQPLVGPVVNAISSAIKVLIDHGATTLVVPGNFPVGCSTMYLTMAHSHNKEDYDPITGCLKKWNEFTEYKNKRLIKELDRLRYRYPHATIIYADYYNIAMRVFRSPHKFGFSKGALTACCGGGGPYNFNVSAPCGTTQAKSCNEPSLYFNWDGIHLTEAAYKWIASVLMEGPHAIPHITSAHSSF